MPVAALCSFTVKIFLIRHLLSHVSVPGTQPGALTQLKFGELAAHDITPESVLLSWTVETGNFDSFIIQYRDADGNPHALPVDGGMRSLRLHDLVPSHKYRFNLYGVSGRKRLGPISTEATTGQPWWFSGHLATISLISLFILGLSHTQITLPSPQ